MASILLGEANPNLRRLYVVLLEQLGHEVIILRADSEVPPRADLLLLEPASPNFLGQARIARERCPALPIIFMSPLSPDARCVTLGPNTYLAKPFTIVGLDTAIEAALGSRGHERHEPRKP